MESTRQQKFSKLIHKELTELFLKHGKTFYGNVFVTVTQVKTTPDLGLMRIHLSVMGTKTPDEVLEKINLASGDIRRRMGIKIRNHVRHVPGFEFFLDTSLDYAENIEKLLKDSNKTEE